MASQLTALGISHTLISLVSLFSGVLALLRDRQILVGNTVGRVYLISMLITCLTGFGIFRNGGWSPAHTLTVVSLAFLVLGLLGNAQRMQRLQAVGFSTSFFLLMIFTVTEALTRLPPQQPLAADQNAPLVNVLRLVVLVAYVTGLTLQLRWLRRRD